MSRPLNRLSLLGLLLLSMLSFGCDGDQDAEGPMETDQGSSPMDAGLADADPADAAAPEPIVLAPTLCDDATKLPAVVARLRAGGSEDADGSFGTGTAGLLEEMLAAPTDGPFYMVNLIRYRERAEYPDGRATDLTGREANALYSPIEFLQAIGARPVFVAPVTEQIDGDDEQWDDVAVVEYPCPLAFFAMITDPDFQARSIHKTAGVERTIVMVTDLVPIPAPADPEQSEATFPPTADDPAFDLIHVMDFHDVAQYGPDANEPERTGREAWETYQASGVGASNALGHYPTAVLEVRGVFTGDQRSFDQVLMVRMSSRAGFQALLDDETRIAGRYHRLAALQHNYSMITQPQLSQIPYADGDAGGGALPVTADGIGTLCNTDEDCPGAGVDRCLSDGGAGFCTREGCGAGECGAPYVCCRDCAEAVAAQLPFAGSACLPEQVVEQLTAAPVSCTCD